MELRWRIGGLLSWPAIREENAGHLPTKERNHDEPYKGKHNPMKLLCDGYGGGVKGALVANIRKPRILH